MSDGKKLKTKVKPCNTMFIEPPYLLIHNLWLYFQFVSEMKYATCV